MKQMKLGETVVSVVEERGNRVLFEVEGVRFVCRRSYLKPLESDKDV